jgi:hypothetical protein
MKPQALYLFALLIVASSAINTFASCPTTTQGPPCQEYWRTDAVFVGLVTRAVRVPNNTMLMVGPYLQSTVYFNVEEAFKGVDGSAAVLELDHCGYLFKENERYLVYAYHNFNTKKLDVRAGNTRTRPLSEAAEDLQYLRGLPSAEPGVRVFGKVALSTVNIKHFGWDSEPLSNIKVILDGKKGRQEVVTDSEGQYEFKGLPADDYEIRAEFPDYLISERYQLGRVSNGCVPVSLIARPKGQIAGRVLDNKGKPLRDVPVSLVSADATLEEILNESKEKAAWAFTYTNEKGSYWFSDLAPGRYLVVINRSEFERSRAAEAARLLPRLFYPGVNDTSGATVIVVGKERKAEEYNFNLPD